MKTAFLFPGQGAQTVGMGAALAADLPAARQLFDRAADILGYDLLELCAERPRREAQLDRLQPAGAVRLQPGGARAAQARCAATPSPIAA